MLAKDPGDRYDSCRDFMEAASAALGDLATAPPASGSLGGVEPTRKDHSATLTTHRPQGETLPPDRTVPPDDAGSSGGRLPRRRPLPARVLAPAVALIVVAAGAGAWALSRGPGSPSHVTTAQSSPAAPSSPAMSASASASAMSTMSTAKPAPPPASDLMKAIEQTASTTHRIAISGCTQMGTTMVTCVHPDPDMGITQVVFQTYPSLPALYAAYQADTKKLKSAFQPNYQGGCDETKTDAEASWNHQRIFSTSYTIAQMAGGMVTDDQAAGRLFCTFSTYEYYVWTQDDGHLLGYAFSQNHANLWNWWVAVHHAIGLGGMPVMPGMGPMSSATDKPATSASGSPKMSPSMAG